MKKKKINGYTIKEIIELITDDKTYSLLNFIKNEEKGTSEILKSLGIHIKVFNYFARRLTDFNMMNKPRVTMKTRFVSINKSGIKEFILILKTLTEDIDPSLISSATTKLNKLT